jgi:hypothetical protein
MKLPRPGSASHRRARQQGLSVLVAITAVAGMVILLAANATTLHWLKQEILRVERHQIERANRPASAPPNALQANPAVPAPGRPGVAPEKERGAP